MREEATVVDKIDYIIRNIDLEENKSLRSFLLEKFCSFPYERIADHNLETYVRIAKKLKIYRLQVDYNKMLQTILENINFVSSLNVIFDFREICPQVFDNLLTLGETKSRISSIVKDELDNATINYTSFEDINSFADEVKAAINNYNLKLNEELEELEEEVGNLEAMEDAGYEYLEDTYKEEATFKRQEEKEELKAIDNLFDSLEPDTA